MRIALKALLAGIGAGLVFTATMLALRLAIMAPAFPERISDTVLLLVPQALFSAGIERFGFAAKPLLFAGIIAAQVAVAGLGGLIYGALAFLLAGRIDLTNPAVGGATGLLLAIGGDFVILPALGVRHPFAAVGGPTVVDTLATTALPGLAYGLALVALLRLLTPPRPQRIAATGMLGIERGRLARRAVVALALPALGALVTAGALRRLLAVPPASPPISPVAQLPPTVAPTKGATATPTTTPTLGTATAPASTPSIAPSRVPISPTTVSSTPPPAAGAIAGGLPSGSATVPPTATTASTATPIPPAPTATPTSAPPRVPTALSTGLAIPAEVAPRITPTEQFYVISKNLLDPTLRAESWQLTIAGLVTRQQTLRQADLLVLPPTRLAATLECISNEPGGDLIGTAHWTGVSLRTLLAGAGIDASATHVVFVCADEYVERLTLAQALDPATLLVYAMNDAPLTAQHGFPARLIAAGRYGMKNPKWVTRIEIVNGAIPSYWSQRGWDPDAPVQVFTRIDAPPQSVGLGTIAVGGVAYAGDRGIARVEISADDGKRWLPAELEPALSPVTWVRWVARWTPPAPGSYTLAARAFEADGTPQVATTRTLNARGSTGLGRREVTVTP